MTTYFISRHQGAKDWAADQGIHVDTMQNHLDIDGIQAGDTVIGTLPINIVAQLTELGISYHHLTLNVPEAMRGKELSAADMVAAGATLEKYTAEKVSMNQRSIPKRNIHICILSNHLFPHYIALKMKEPDEVWVVVSEKMKREEKSKQFAEMSQKANVIYVEIEETLSDAIYQEQYVFFEKLAEKVKNDRENRFTLNLTGGNKLMSLAAYEVLKNHCHDIIYVDTDTNKLEFINKHHPAESTFEEIRSVLTIKDHLIAYGFSKKIIPVSEEVINNILENEKLTINLASVLCKKDSHNFLKKLNECARAAHKEKGGSYELTDNPKQEFQISPLTEEHESLLKRLSDAGLAKYDANYIEFLSGNAARYLNGDWLEHFAYLAAKENEPQEVTISQRIYLSNENDRNNNELDVILVHNNRMLVVECKTIKSLSNNELYKSDNISQKFRGLFGEQWILSTAEPNQEIQERADKYRIRIIHSEDILNLKQHIQTWMQGKGR